MIKPISYAPPFFDNLVKANVYILQLKIKEYLQLVDLDENPFQRNVLDYDVYYKLVKDILMGAIFPPISVVYKDKVDLKEGFKEDSKFMILDGLQRTNCLFVCKKILEGEITEGFSSIYETSEKFLDTSITLEVWEGLDLKDVLYKIIVLNTGQKKMDSRHQLDIMVGSLKDFLKENQIKFIELKEKISEEITSTELLKTNSFPLFSIAEGVVAYVNKYPQFTQKSTTEFLFDKLDLDPENYKEGIKIIENENTYIDLVWVLKDFSDLLFKKYGYNIFIKYPLFLSSFLASMGYTRAEFPEEQIKDKKEVLSKLLLSNQKDPINIETYLGYHKEFTTGIGAKRRKLVFTAFKNFFASPVSNKVEWSQAFQEVK